MSIELFLNLSAIYFALAFLATFMIDEPTSMEKSFRLFFFIMAMSAGYLIYIIDFKALFPH
jgi:hypothetical protein